MVLERIIEHKRGEVSRRKEIRPLEGFIGQLEPSGRSLAGALAKEETSFFLEAERVLSPAAFRELESKVDNASDPLFDPHGGSRLANLRTYFMDLNEP